jgi:hypothetical protein
VANLQRGRVSASARSMIATHTMADLEKGTRPEPPEDLTEAEAKVWRNVVASMPPDWFSPATFPLLGLYCRHTAGLDFIDRVLRSLEKSKEPKAASEWRKMAQARRQECKVIYSLAVKMRLAQQSSYAPEKAYTVKNHARRVKAAATVESVKQQPWA